MSNCSYFDSWPEEEFVDDSNDSSSSPMMMLSPEADYACRIYDFVIETVFMGALCAFGFVGNMLSAVCLWKDKSKSATPFLLISLALADTLFLVTVLHLRAVTSVPTFDRSLSFMDPLTSYIGKYVYPWAMITNMGTIYITVLVTVNRYISVCKPYDASSLCSIPNARKQVVVVWLFSILFNVPRFFEYQIGEYPEPVGSPEDCQFTMKLRSEPTSLTENRIYTLIYINFLYFLIMFLVPLISLIVLNYNLIMALRETRRKRETMKSRRPGGHPNDLGQNVSSRSEDDITLMLIVVVVIFVVTQGPALVTQILDGFLEKSCPTFFFFYQRISDLLVVVNSSVNFIAYCFCSRRFRRILLSLLRGRNPDPESCEVVPETAAQTVDPTTAATMRYGHRSEGKNGAAQALLRCLTERNSVRSNNGIMNDVNLELQETRPIVE